MEATDVTSAGTPPFVPPRLSAPALWWLRWNIFASRWPGLRDAVALAARACAACALVLAAARAGTWFASSDDDAFTALRGGLRRRRGWKHAEASAEVYRGAAALVVPFVLLPALAVTREYLARVASHAARRRRPRFDASVVFLADARDETCRAAARARDDADARRRDASSSFSTRDVLAALLASFTTNDASHRTSHSRELRVADGDDAEPVVRDALATMARATRRAGGEDAARWLAALREQNALPPTTALVLVRDVSANGRIGRESDASRSKGERHRRRGGDTKEDDDDGAWSRAPSLSASLRGSRTTPDAGEVSEEEEGDDDDASSSSDTSTSSSSGSGSSDDPAASLAVALVVHVVPGVPRRAVGPPASARGVGGWRGDAHRFAETCPETVSLAVVEVPRRGGAPGAFVGDASSASSADVAEAVASVAASLARRLGVHAVVFPVAEDAPTPFLASALAKRGAHAVLRRPADDPGFVLRLREGGAWDGATCGAHARARRDHRRRARRFASIGGTVAEAEASATASASKDRLLEDDWTRDSAWPMAWSFASAHTSTSADDHARGALASVSSGRSAFARADARAVVAAARAASSPVDGDAFFWRVLEARVGGERVGALLLDVGEAAPSGGGGGSDPRNRRNRRVRRSDASELAAGSRDRVWVRACWLHPDAARSRDADAYRALLRGAVAFAAARGCARVDFGPGGAREKLRMGAMPARATAMVLYDDWTLGAPADADASGLSEDLLRWASNGSRGRRGAAWETTTTTTAATTTRATTAPTTAPTISPVPSKRAARRAARLERRRALKMSRVASRAFRAAAAEERAKTASARGMSPRTIHETIDAAEDDAGEYYNLYSDEDSDEDDDDVLFVDADEDAA
jgi:hypothetical protein